MVPAAMVDATRRMSAQFLSIRSAFTLPPTSGRSCFGTPARSNTYSRFDGRSRMRGTNRVAEDRARGEDMVGEATRIGVLFADAPPGLVHQESVEDVGGFVDGGGDGLGGEREGLAKARASGRQLGRPKGSLGVSRLDGKEDDIRHFLELGVSKTAIAKITGVSRTALYSFMSTRGLNPNR